MSGSVYHNENNFYSNRIFRETLNCVKESKGALSLSLLFSPTKLVYFLLIKLYFLINGNPFKLANEKLKNSWEIPDCDTFSCPNSENLGDVQCSPTKSRAMFELTSYFVRTKWTMKILIFEECADYLILLVDGDAKNQIKILLPDLVYKEDFLKVKSLSTFQSRLNELITHKITFDNV